MKCFLTYPAFVRSAFVYLAFLCSAVCFAQESLLPEAWQAEWRNPSVAGRPLQIIHGGIGSGEAGVQDRIAELKNYALGGAVINVSSQDYLRNEESWADLVRFVKASKEAGLRVWIYDEDGYPSPMAGGLLLRERPDLEAKELVYDAVADTFTVRDCFEFTHASNNYAGTRRYPSLVTPAVGPLFLQLTHEAYKKHLGPELFSYVEAFFTDEPSTNALNTGTLPNEKKNIRIVDKEDPNKPNLPMVAWADDFPELYRKLYGEDLLAVRKSLFAGDTEADRKVRRQFWQMVAGRCVESYYGPIQKWCQANGVAASGHTLWEEYAFLHVPLDGDKLEVLKRFDIPGMDLLSSTPEIVMYWGWKTAILPMSAAILNGTRKVFTEVSDFDSMIAGRACVAVSWMQATAAWKAAFGVTEFTLYYDRHKRKPEEYKEYCDFVGRLNAILRPAQIERHTVVYYPIRDLQENFLPSKDRTELENQTPKVREVTQSWYTICEGLARNQIPFYAAGVADLPRMLQLPADHPCKPLHVVIPAGVKLTETLETALAAFKKSGGRVFRGEICLDAVIHPQHTYMVHGTFRRDGQSIHVLVNTQNPPYTGRLRAVRPGECLILDPQTGTVEKQTANQDGLEITLGGMKTLIIVQPR